MKSQGCHKVLMQGLSTALRYLLVFPICSATLPYPQDNAIFRGDMSTAHGLASVILFSNNTGKVM